jgi:hypothetical protein
MLAQKRHYPAFLVISLIAIAREASGIFILPFPCRAGIMIGGYLVGTI